MEVYEYISESLMTTGDLILEYYPDLPLEFIVIPLIIFICVFLKQRSRNMQKQTCVAYPRSIRQYISMMFQQKLFWHIQEKYRGKENDISDLLKPQPYEEKLGLLLGTVWKRKKRALAEKAEYIRPILESEAIEASLSRMSQVQNSQILPETESNSDQDDGDDVSEYTVDSMETATQSEQVLTEINLEASVSEAGDSDFKTAECASTHIDLETTEQSYSSDNGEDVEEENEEKAKDEELITPIPDAFEDSLRKLEEMPIQTNENAQEEPPHDEEVGDTLVQSPQHLETASGNEVREPIKDCGGEGEGKIKETNYETRGAYIVKDEENLLPPSEARCLEEETIMPLKTILEEEEDSLSEV